MNMLLQLRHVGETLPTALQVLAQQLLQLSLAPLGHQSVLFQLPSDARGVNEEAGVEAIEMFLCLEELRRKVL